MDTLKFVLTVIQFIVSLGLVVAVLAQESKSSGMGAMMGVSSETFFGKNKGRTKEAMLKKLTIVGAIVFAVLTLVIYIL